MAKSIRTMFYPSIFTFLSTETTFAKMVNRHHYQMTEFSEAQGILRKQKQLAKSIGKGNKPNSADPLTDEEIEQLYCEFWGNKTSGVGCTKGE